MNYSDFIVQKIKYDQLIEDRIMGYLEIAKEETTILADNKTGKLKLFRPNSSAETYLTGDISKENIDYDYTIELEFEIHYSGCGSEVEWLYLPDWILLEDDKEYQTALNDYADSIHDKNRENESLMKVQEDNETASKEKVKLEKERKEYERLKKIFENIFGENDETK